MNRQPIRPLPEDLALKIAAGEVVERPASAVKELLDNAIDAGARNIRIEIREGGLKLIRVWDDGCGIPRDELPLAFSSHATSKIADLHDLENLTTLGFRGEALPSIAAVSTVEVQTFADGDRTGSRYLLEYGRLIDQGACSVPRGLRISVQNLFANVPARRKFVRSQRAEGGQIQSLIMQYALAHPHMRFVLTTDGRITFSSPGNGRLADAVAAVHGPTAPASMHVVDVAENGVEVRGLISGPELTRPNRTAVTIFVNGRTVANRSLVFALEEAYSGFLMIGRHPVAAIHLTLDPSDVDANIHPAKSEVRFARERDVHAVLHRAVANTLFEIRLRSRQLASDLISRDDGLADPLTSAQTALPVEPAEPETSASLLPVLPALRVFGQTNATFIIAEGPQGLYMIDQHAAHERILFDRLEEHVMNGGVAPSQPLLEPATVELTAPQMLALEENKDVLTGLGFELDPFGGSACLIRSVPAVARGGGPGELVVEVLDELGNLPEPGAARERALAAVACKAAVKAGQSLDVQEMRELVEQLERTRRPNTCPHGRPTMIHLSHTQLEREFGRR